MASLLSSSTPTTPFQHNPRPPKPSHTHFLTLPIPTPLKKSLTTCNASTIQSDIITTLTRLDDALLTSPLFQSGLSQVHILTDSLPDGEKWGFVVVAGLVWTYLTARPGVLVGAIDAYLLAPLQIGLDSLTGRRRLQMEDFVVGQVLGEGSFGVVYSGAIVPKNMSLEEKLQKIGKGKGLRMDKDFKDRVILKKVNH